MSSPLSSSSASRPLSAAQSARQTYLKHLLSQATQSPAPTHLQALRQTAQALVEERSFPGPRDEDWRFTDLSHLLSVSYGAAIPPGAPDDALRARIDALRLPEAQACLVLVNGYYSDTLSDVTALPAGVQVSGLATLTAPERLRPYLAQMPDSPEVFTTLNTAGLTDGVAIWTDPDCVVERPIQIIYLAIGEARLVQPRCLVHLANHSQLSLVEQFCSDGNHLVNGVTELWLQAGARLTHTRLQQEALTVSHIGKTAISQAADSQYQGTALSLGGRLCRHHWQVYQAGPQTETQLIGLSALRGDQVADTHSLIALGHPQGTAQQLQKNIVDGRAQAIFNGKVYVPQAAQLTNASQLNRNLLLSAQGRVDTKPELDIVADNVKCAHGATVSQLAADEIFYLQSRGIDADQAQRLLLYAFAMEVIETITVPSLKQHLTDYITEWSA